MPNEVIKVDNVSFRYVKDVDVIKNASFSIYENEYICIIGHNGSGKSTMSKILMGLLQPYKGKISLFGKVIDKYNIDYLRDNIGVIFQNPDSQFIGITAEDDIAFGLENRMVPRKEIKQRVIAAAKKVHVEELLPFESQKLSGGQKQKVAIAGVLAINPEVIIFDESTSMLDPKGKKELKELMLELKEKEHKTIISITHDMDEVINATRVIVMNKGEVFMIDKPKNIFTHKKNLNEIHLDVPFAMKLSLLLNQKNKKIEPVLTQEQLVESLCKKTK